VFGLLTNLWFWPFAVGAGTGISYVPGAPLGTNLSSFLLYSLVTSTAGWDTLRGITTVVGIAVVGRAILAALRRVKPVSRAGGQAAKASSAQARDRLQLTP
jgi:energy-coupling factor transport system ATP-binding protein